jgi:hypothetical protein
VVLWEAAWLPEPDLEWNTEELQERFDGVVVGDDGGVAETLLPEMCQEGAGGACGYRAAGQPVGEASKVVGVLLDGGAAYIGV